MQAHELIPFLDLTTLGTTDSADDVRALAKRAMQPVAGDPAIHCAALCTWPNFAAVATEALDGSPVVLACVAAAFPCSQAPLEVKTREIELAVAAGAKEIDIAIPRGLLLSGDLVSLRAELEAMKSACGAAHLKVILETCDLGDADTIRTACQVALEAGADFLKTSTGMGKHGATPDHARILFEAAREWHANTGQVIGVKPAGGIRTYADALVYHELASSHLPEVTPSTFRLGASSLLDDLLSQA
ncbi:deoxyribose-phosphate aldolase [Haloferula sp. A504]|uniref:deoxyribose-phosphate aldolase n=1 Tax=Haloferula sp. A504 TaxID=3373601 RepID=UPI0031C922D7|nr:deoxyribose-phosphate aldolase [Verrucomicrobiaceae bacterium E54]